MDSRLQSTLASVFGLREADIREELTQDDVGAWDSLKQMDLVVSLENEYGIALEIPDIIRMTSVADIVAVLREKGVNLED
jgi:acyl carrier protein